MSEHLHCVFSSPVLNSILYIHAFGIKPPTVVYHDRSNKLPTSLNFKFLQN